MSLCWSNQPLSWQKTNWTSTRAHHTLSLLFGFERRHGISMQKLKSSRLLTQLVERSLDYPVNWHFIILWFTGTLWSSLRNFFLFQGIFLREHWRFMSYFGVSAWKHNVCKFDRSGIIWCISFLWFLRFTLISSWGSWFAIFSFLWLSHVI